MHQHVINFSRNQLVLLKDEDANEMEEFVHHVKKGEI